MKFEPFRISIPDHVLEDTRRRLSCTRWPGDFANDDWRYGTNQGYLTALADYWMREYDWRHHEAAMNSFSHFKVDLDGIPIHFIWEKGKGPSPLPLILTHGWSSSFWDMRKIIRPLADPAAFGGDPADAFDVIVPSLPGYGFSSPLEKPGINAFTTADMWKTLMHDVLGYQTFAAHGGDWGSTVSAQLGHKYPQYVRGLHLLGGAPLDFMSTGLPTLESYAPDEKALFEKTVKFFTDSFGYGHIQGTKPQTLAYGLSDSPMGICAWLLEKWRDTSDCQGDVEQRFSKDDLITTAMLYWLTNTAGTSSRFYYETRNTPWPRSHDASPAVGVPTAVMQFERDVTHWPRSVMARFYNVMQWTRVSQGAHYPTVEEPERVIEDLRTFFRRLRR